MAVKLERPGADHEQSRDEAFAELYEGTYDSLVGYCRGLLGDGGDAEAAAQEAFLRAWMSWDRYSSRPFWALVATIARNLCMDHHRHERVVTSVLAHRAGELSSARDPEPEEQLERDEEYRWAREALAQLQPNHQRLLDLREVNGWSCEAIAEAEGTNADSVAATLYRARQRLREAYSKLATGALGAVGLLPLRPLRRRLGLWAHYGGEVAASSPAITARAGEAIAAAVALAVVSTGGPAVSPPPPVHEARPAAHAIGAPAPSKAAADKPSPAPVARDHGAATEAKGEVKPSVPATVPPDMALSPDQATFSQVAAPAGASNSNEVFATGVSLEGCATSCPVVFHSGDGGASWQRLAAVGFAGGTLVLPPDFPTDNRIFVAGPTSMQVSTDGGATFTTVAPVGGASAISPAFAKGDPRILLGGAPGWEYHDDLKTVTPLQLGPLPASQGLSFAFAPRYPGDQRVLVGGARTDDSDHLHSSVVSVCRSSTCDSAVPLPGSDGVPSLLASRSFEKSGLAFAWAGERLYRSSDGGASFRTVASPAPGGVQALIEDVDGTLYTALLGADTDGHSVGGVFVSHDEGRTWNRLGDDTALGKGASTVATLPSGHLVAAPGTGGFLCSADGGKTWAAHCPAPPQSTPQPAPRAANKPAGNAADSSGALGQPAGGGA